MWLFRDKRTEIRQHVSAGYDRVVGRRAAVGKWDCLTVPPMRYGVGVWSRTHLPRSSHSTLVKASPVLSHPFGASLSPLLRLARCARDQRGGLLIARIPV